MAFVGDLKHHRLSNLQPTLLALYEGNLQNDSLIQQVIFHRAVPDFIFVVLKDEVDLSPLSPEQPLSSALLRKFGNEASGVQCTPLLSDSKCRRCDVRD